MTSTRSGLSNGQRDRKSSSRAAGSCSAGRSLVSECPLHRVERDVELGGYVLIGLAGLPVLPDCRAVPRG